MKVTTKPRNSKIKRQRTDTKNKITKQIEAKLQKQQFFSHVMKQIDKQFAKDDLQFLLQHLQNIIIHNKKRNTQSEESNGLQSVKTHETDTLVEDKNKEEGTNHLKRIDTNVFREGLKKLSINRLSLNATENRQYFSTPKFTKRLSRNIFPKKIFEMDRTMQRNYERTRSRLFLNNANEPLKDLNSFRASYITNRQSKTQRGMRYKTEAQQTDTTFQQKSIPLILMGDIFGRSDMKKQSKQNFEQKRMECLLNNMPISPMIRLKRYMVDH